MSWKLRNLFKLATNKKTAVILLSVVFFLGAGATESFSQKKFSKSYPASKNIRLQLANRTGTIVVRGWDRDEINISAWLEKPIAKIEPKNLSGSILINVVKDNQGRKDVGSVNFTIYVPYESTIDITTYIGNLEVSNVRGGYVSAQISAEGDIRLLNIGSASVSAKNVTGDIFYDGFILPEGTYRFTSMKGNISLRIPFKASFRLVATAPSSRYISLGAFRNTSMSYVGNGRREVGKVGDGSASITVTNQLGTISLLER